jgi:C-terminal processing protease CtpA/Prc
MDTWSLQQIETMRQGGNDQIRDFFRKLEIHNSPISTLYSTKGASHYREKLKERVEKIMKGEIPSARNTTKAFTPTIKEISSTIKTVSGNKKEKIENFTATFAEGPMGMTITKDFKGSAVISKLVPGGQGNIAGILVGDCIVGVAGKILSDYDEIMHMIPYMKRPVQLTVTRVNVISNANTKPISPTNLSITNTILPSTGLTPRLKDKSPVDGEGVKKEKKVTKKAKSIISVTSSGDSINNLVNSNGLSSVRNDINADFDDDNIEETNNTKSSEHVKNGDKNGCDDQEDDEENEDNQEDEDENDDDDDDDEEEEEEDDDDGNNEASVMTHSVVTYSPGDYVKVNRKGKFRSAIIIRQHSDGASYKVTFRDGSTESHVTVDRITLPEGSDAKNQVEIEVIPPIINNAISNNNHINYAIEDTEGKCEDFVVTNSDSVDLDDWINNDSAISNSLTIDKTGGAVTGKPINSEYVDLDYIDNSSNNNSHAGSVLNNGTDYTVVFAVPKLGLTLSKNLAGNGEVTKITTLGQAEKLGVVLGDLLLGINGNNVRGYDDAMSILPNCDYPLSITFRRGMRHSLLNTGETIVQGSKLVATKTMELFGIKKEESILQAKTEKKFSNKHSMNGNPNASHSPEGLSGNKMTTKKMLEGNISSKDEFDVSFDEGELGARFEERDGIIPVSVVTNITEHGQAKIKGVKVGCIILGVNGEKFISHAHTVATLKHAKRPVIVRFKLPPKY